MSTGAFWFAWYFFCAIYTYAMTIAWPSNIHCARAAALWPVFWGVVVFRRWVKP